MINNPSFFNAAVAGLNGSQERWLKGGSGTDYSQLVTIVAEIAHTIDSTIPSFGPLVDLSEDSKLLQGIVSEVFSSRPLFPTAKIDYTEISLSIANLFLQMRNVLIPIPVPPSPPPANIITINRVHFNYSSGTLILGTALIGMILAKNQVVIETAFDSGSSISFGTFLNPSLFSSVDSSAENSYVNNQIIPIESNDFLVLTVNTSGSNGTGSLYYEVQL